MAILVTITVKASDNSTFMSFRENLTKDQLQRLNEFANDLAEENQNNDQPIL